MEIVTTFGFRKYIFHSEQDIFRARSLWVLPGTQKQFEDRLEDERIEFEYEME